MTSCSMSDMSMARHGARRLGNISKVRAVSLMYSESVRGAALLLPVSEGKGDAVDLSQCRAISEKSDASGDGGREKTYC